MSPALRGGFFIVSHQGSPTQTLFKCFSEPGLKGEFRLSIYILCVGLPQWLSGNESACQCRRQGFDPWVEQIPWKRKWQPTPICLPGKSHGQRSLVGYSLGCRKRVGHDLATKQQQSYMWKLGVEWKHFLDVK